LIKTAKSVSARDLFAAIRRDNPAVIRAERELGSRLILARNVLRLRVQRGLTQSALADRAGVRQPRIAEIEGSRTNPRLETLDRIAAAFAVPVATLFKEPERERGALARASVPVSSAGSVGIGWGNSEVVRSIFQATKHFSSGQAAVVHGSGSGSPPIAELALTNGEA
jgi:transcriptional regulator with XRE-family HTH domain